MRHNRNYRGLPHICAFARHIRTGYNHCSVFRLVQKRVVGNKPLFGNNLYYRVTPFLYYKRLIAFRNFGTDIAVCFCNFRKCRNNIQICNAFRNAFKAFDIFCENTLDFFVDFYLHFNCGIHAGHYFYFQLLQFVGYKPFGVGKGLLALIA